MGKHHPPDDDNQRTFGFVSPHERRLRSGRRVPVTAHWRHLPGPQAPPRAEPPPDEGPRAAAPVITLSVTVHVYVTL